MTDPISDMLTQIRNTQAAGHKTVDFPYSKIKFDLAKLLSAEGYLGSVQEKGKGAKRKIEVNLKYKDKRNTEPKIQSLIRVSKPGQRIYITKKDLISASQGRGIIVLTTSNGLITGKDARKKGVGGELICRIW